jgi:CBS domain-containing membrane protein
MTTDLVTLKETDSVALARRIMGEQHIRHLPIHNEMGAFVGLLTQRDVLAATVSVLAEVDQETINAMEAAIPIRELMTTAMTTVREDTSLREAALLLLELKVGCLPVLSDSRLLGIVTEADFIKFVLRVLDRL